MNPRAVMVGCPEVALYYLVNLRGERKLFSAGDLVHLGKLAESASNLGAAMSVYGLIEEHCADSKELEMALYRFAAVLWHGLRDGIRAVEKLDKLLRLFPNGALMFDAEDLRDMILRENGEGRRLAA